VTTNTEDFREGDLVEAHKGKRIVTDEVTRTSNGQLYLGPATDGWALHWYRENGFELELLDRPEPELPTDNGAYYDRHGRPWSLVDGAWYYGGKRWAPTDITDYAPFTRLEPVQETAKRVLDWVDDQEWPLGTRLVDILDTTRKKFNA